MHRQAGNIFFFLFGAVAVAGVLGVSIQNYVMGPLKSATMVNKRNVADTEMQLSLRTMAIAAAQNQTEPDCDSDGFIEPIPYTDAGANPHPAGGGVLPSTIGGAKRDPWGSDYGYCVWDHGPLVDDPLCGNAAQLRLPGTNSNQWEVIAIISAGPDRQFQTNCNEWADLNMDTQPDTPLLNKPAGSDDLSYAWNYQEASGSGGGLWTLDPGDPDEAEIQKNLSVKDSGGTQQLGFDTTAKTLTIGAGGAGEFPTVRTDYIGLMTLTNPSIELLDAIGFAPEDSSGSTFYARNPTGDSLQITPTANGSTIGLNVTSSGAVAIGATSSYDARNILTLSGTNSDLGIVSTDPADATIAADVNMYRTRGGAAVQSGDRLGGLVFWGKDAASADVVAARIFSVVDGTPGAADMPGRLEFYVAPDGSTVSATPQMVIKNSGFVGIPTGTPAALLDVGSSATMRMLLNNSVDTANDPYNMNMDNTAAAHSIRRFTLSTLTGAEQHALQFGDGAATDTVFGVSHSANSGATWAPSFIIQGNGEIGMGGITEPTAALHVGGNINYSGTITDVSDRRMKENIRPLESPLEKLTMLDGYAFEMKGDAKKQTEYGVIAQDVQKVFPELVHEIDKDGHLGVTYDGLIAPIIESIKGLKAENEKLRAEIDALKAGQKSKD